MAENTVRIEGMNPISGSFPVMISGTLPPGTALPVAQAAPAASSAPLPASILSGSVLDDESIITIPAGKIWYGWMGLSASLAGASQTCTVSIATSGSGAVPDPSVTLVSTTLTLGVTNDGQASNVSTPYIYVYAPAGNSIDLRVFLDGGAAITATAYGFILS